MNNKKAELLSPAGNLLRLKTALLYGADSVYVGSPSLSLRSKSEFTVDDLKEAMEIVNKLGKKLYITLNLFSHNSDVEKLEEFVKIVNSVKPHGVLVADGGVFDFVKENCPQTPIHISTQANICSYISVNFWKKQGASLCVMAREVSFNELKEIKEKSTDIKIEAFIHGAMCMTYSGRCLLSNFMAERRSNQGSCAHSCRWSYKLKIKPNLDKIYELEVNDKNKEFFDFALEEEYRKGEYYEIEEDDKGSYILNSKDLCLMPVLKDYLDIGVDTLKIEGRHKSEYYVAITAKAYREAMDSYYKDKENFNYLPYLNELYSVSNRGYTTAFHDGRLTNLAHNFETSKTLSNFVYCGTIKDHIEGGFIFEAKNFFESGDIIEFVSPFNVEPVRLRLYEFINNKTREGLVKVSAGSGEKSEVFISYSHLNNENIEDFKKNFPALTVARKDNPDLETVNDFVRYSKISLKAELGESSLERVAKAKEKIENIDINAGSRKPKLGKEGCCYKGCNGCMIFWDSKDEKIIAMQEKYKGLKK